MKIQYYKRKLEYVIGIKGNLRSKPLIIEELKKISENSLKFIEILSEDLKENSKPEKGKEGILSIEWKNQFKNEPSTIIIMKEITDLMNSIKCFYKN